MASIIKAGNATDGIQFTSDATGALDIKTGTGAGTTAVSIDASGNFLFNSGYGSVATAYGCRAWVNFNGTGTIAIRASGNVSSITDNGVGDYTPNFTTTLPDANYAVVIAKGALSTTTNSGEQYVQASNTTSSVTVRVYQNGVFADINSISVAVFR